MRVEDCGTLDIRYYPLESMLKLAAIDMESAEPITYSAMREFGGWGLRENDAMRAHTMAGSKGVRIKLVPGADGVQCKDILVGTEQAEEVAELLNKAIETARAKRDEKVLRESQRKERRKAALKKQQQKETTQKTKKASEAKSTIDEKVDEDVEVARDGEDKGGKAKKSKKTRTKKRTKKESN